MTGNPLINDAKVAEDGFIHRWEYYHCPYCYETGPRAVNWIKQTIWGCACGAHDTRPIQAVECWGCHKRFWTTKEHQETILKELTEEAEECPQDAAKGDIIDDEDTLCHIGLKAPDDWMLNFKKDNK